MKSTLNLSQMAQGAFLEQFHREMDQVLANIADPNTEAKKPRKITLTATLKPDENREVISFEVQSKASLIPPKPLTTNIIIDRGADGSVIGAELLSGAKGQTYIDSDNQVKDDRGNVVAFNQPAVNK